MPKRRQGKNSDFRTPPSKKEAVEVAVAVPMWKRHTEIWVAAMLLALAVVAYLPAMRGGMLWDDNAHVTRPDLQSLTGLGRIWFEVGATQQYYPLLYSAFWVEHQLWGDHTLGYHLVNVLEHAVAAWLLYLVLRRLKIPGALLAAAIFTVHPIEVESVAWIAEQKNTLSAIFYLAAMRVYLEFDESRQRSRYVMALVLFVFGLLTKTVTASLPAALLVIFWWQRGTLAWRRDVWPLAPFFVLWRCRRRDHGLARANARRRGRHGVSSVVA